MYVILSRKVHEAIVTIAQTETPRESVGILLGRFEPMDYTTLTIFDCLPLSNSAAEPTTHFVIDGRSLKFLHTVKAGRNGNSFVALWHSHPKGRPIPSKDDCAVLFESKVPMLILGLSPHPEGRLYSMGKPRKDGQRPIHEVPMVVEVAA